MRNLLRKNNNGFTLVETLVAISILMLSVTGPLYLASSGLQASFFARDQITAFYLVQDALETIRNYKDQNAFSGSWNTFRDNIVSECGGGSGCTIDSVEYFKNSDFFSSVVNSCTGTCNPIQIYKTPNSIEYGYSNNLGEDSRFTRSVFVKRISDDEIKVRVEMKWKTSESSSEKTFSAVENMFNWR